MTVLSEMIKECVKKTGSDKHEVELIINTFVEELVFALCPKKSAKISRFGTFEIRKRKNIENGGYIKFKQSRLISKLLNLTIGGHDCGKN